MYLELADHDARWADVYRLAITFVVPRPIGWVSTVSPDGRRNLAPFSFYNMVSGNPPVVIFCPALRRDGQPKDSLRNVEQTGQFVVATATEALAQQMNDSSVDAPYGVDEFELVGLTPAPARLVRPALVAESPVNIECTLIEVKRFGDFAGAGQVFFGRVVAIHVNDDVLAPDGLVDPARLRALGRMGRLTYCRTTDTFDLPRPGRVNP